VATLTPATFEDLLGPVVGGIGTAAVLPRRADPDDGPRGGRVCQRRGRVTAITRDPAADRRARRPAGLGSGPGEPAVLDRTLANRRGPGARSPSRWRRRSPGGRLGRAGAAHQFQPARAGRPGVGDLDTRTTWPCSCPARHSPGDPRRPAATRDTVADAGAHGGDPAAPSRHRVAGLPGTVEPRQGRQPHYVVARAGRALDATLDGLPRRGRPPVRTSAHHVIGHSYGTLVIDRAAGSGSAGRRRRVLLGSPGWTGTARSSRSRGVRGVGAPSTRSRGGDVHGRTRRWDESSTPRSCRRLAALHTGYYDDDGRRRRDGPEVVAGSGSRHDPLCPGTRSRSRPLDRVTARPRWVATGLPVGPVAYRGVAEGARTRPRRPAPDRPAPAPSTTDRSTVAPRRPRRTARRRPHGRWHEHARPPPDRRDRRRPPAGHRGVPDQGREDRRVPGQRLRRRGQRRAHPRPAAQRRRRAGRAQGCVVGAPRRRRRQRVRAALRGQPRPQAAGQPAQAAGQGRQRGLPRHRRGPRGRGHRLAPGRHAQAAGAGAPHGLPRDHPRGDRPRRGQPAGAGHRAGRRAGDPPHPRPALRLRGQPRAVEEGAAQALGRAGAVGGHPDRGRARARADGVPRRRLLVARGDLRRRRAAHRGPTTASRGPCAPAWSASTTAGSPPAATSTPRPAG
jgi:hypothetical protein